MLKWLFSGVMFILLLTSTLSLTFNIQPVRSSPATITVPDDYSSIQEAINHAGERDTIFVRNGTYYENVVINKTVSLIGENREATILDGNENGTVVLVLANNTMVRGFTIKGSGDKTVDGEHAIRCGIMGGGYETPFENTLIVNNSIKDNYFGVLLWYSFNSQLIDNNIEDSTYGVALDHVFHSDIVDNNVSNNSLGISAQNTLQSNITRNNITFNKIVGLRMQDSCLDTINENIMKNNGYGVDFSGSDSNNITGNTISSNDNGIFLGRSNGNTLVGNNASNSFYGMRIHLSSNNTLRNNTMTQNYWNFAIDADYLSETIHDIDASNTVDSKPIVYWIDEHDKQVTTDAGFVAAINCSGITVKNVNLTRNNLGVLFWGTSNSTIENASISNNWIGVVLLLSNHTKLENSVVVNNSEEGVVSIGNENNITGNTIRSNGRTALLLSLSNKNIVNNNTISNNGESSIGLESSCNNTITNNEMLNNTGGISLYSYSNDNLIHGNTVLDSHEIGIQLTFHSKSNIIYHNNFIDNAVRAYCSEESMNVWDDGYPSGGNYWSDYTGIDANGDGSGDTPYVIDVDNQDRYPLMHAWSSLPVHDINTGLGYATIQEAINANETLNGHTIFVETGAYYENVVVNKSLTISGEDKDTTFVDGSPGSVVFLVESDNVCISGFTIQNGNTGVQSEAQNATINDNIITNSTSQGIQVGGASNIIGRNLIVNCGAAIIVFGNDHTIEQNFVMNNKYSSIHLYGGSGNKVRGNVITGNEGGEIYVMSSDNNTISDNVLMNNGEGIRIAYSTGNVVFHNHIINNTRQVFIDRGNINNTWDDGYPSGGNYWSDYNGPDLYSGLYQNETGRDGIGDVPYIIDADNQDNYPLMPPYVPVLGDLNQDGIVNVLDAIQTASVFGLHAGDPGWNEQADINRDGVVNILDVIILASNFGKR